MPRSLCLSFASLLILASPAFAETDGEVYETVDSIIAEAEEGVRENLTTFVQANERPLGKARGELAELIARLNKDGRSQLATSIQKRVNTLEETVQKRACARVPIAGEKNEALLKRFVGTWRSRSGSGLRTTIDEHGNYTETYADSGKVKETGKLKVIRLGVAQVVLTNGWRLELRPAGEEEIAVLHWTERGVEEGDGAVYFRVQP